MITGNGYTLHHGDAVEVMRSLPDSSVDLIATDPPYHRVKSLAWDRQHDTTDGFLAWLDSVAAEWWRVLRPNGSLYVFASPKMAARVEVLIGERFNVLNNIRWSKPPYSTKAEMFDKSTMRSYFPASENIIFAEHHNADTIAKGEAGYVAACDDLRGFVFEPLRAYIDGERQRAGVHKHDINEWLGFRRVGGMAGRHYFSQSQWCLPTEEHYNAMRECLSSLNHGGAYLERPHEDLRREYEDLRREYEDLRREYEDLRREYEDLRRPFNATPDAPYTDVWEFPTVQAYAGKHPCEKPVSLMSHIINMSSKPGAVVLDTFGGRMTTGVACLETGRQFIGIEKDARYFESGAQRLADAMLQPALLDIAD